jgi:hypothetical protein
LTRLPLAIARVLLELAAALVIFALLLVFVACWIAGAPYRRRRGPGLLEAAQQLLLAGAGLVSAVRSQRATAER